MSVALARFIVPVNPDGTVDVAKKVRVLDAEVRGSYAEILVDERGARYLRERRYATEVALPNSHLSISQINTYLRCPLQYYWRYVEGLKVPPASAVTFGLATHRAIEHNYSFKVVSGEDRPVEEVQEVFAREFDSLAPGTQWEEGEEPGAVKDEGIKTTALYMREVAPVTKPVAVEQPFEVEFENVEYTLKGVVDLVDASETIIDTKTSKRAPSPDQLERDLQLTAYSLGYRAVTGRTETGLRMDYVVRTKTPKIVSLKSGPRDEREVNRLLKLIGYVARAIRDRLFFPQPHNFTCNPNGCGYWTICQERW